MSKLLGRILMMSPGEQNWEAEARLLYTRVLTMWKKRRRSDSKERPECKMVATK